MRFAKRWRPVTLLAATVACILALGACSAGSLGSSDEAQAAARLLAFLDAPSSQLVDALAPPGLVEGGQALHARLDGLLPA